MSENYHIEDIDADTVAVGNHAKAIRVTVEKSLMQTEALKETRKLIMLLPDYADMIDRPDKVQADAKAVEVALSKNTLKRARIENLIRKIAIGVAGVTTLANAVDAVQVAVSRLFT